MAEEQSRSSGIPRFKLALLNISKDLTKRNVEDMKFLCPENVGEARLEDVKTGLELFKLLIQNEHLSEDNTTILKDMLHETEQAVLWKRFQQEMGITTRTSPDVYQPQPKELDFTSATPIDNTDDETPAKCLVGDGDLDKASMVKSKQITMTGQSQQCGPSMTERIRDLTIDSPDTDDKIYNNKPSNYTAHSTHRQMGLQSSESNNLVNFDIETDSPDKEEEEKESACGPAFHSNNSTNKTDLLDESNTEFSPPLSSYTSMMEETPRRITAENVSKQLTFGKASCEEEDDELKLSRLDLSLPSEHADVKPKSGNRTCDDSTQKPAKTTKKIELYEYQKELVQPGLNGENYIICAPTGSGKTIAAAALCNELHKHAESDFKAVFIVPTRSLVQQQSDALKTFLPANSVAGINETDEVIEVFKNKDILVMTAQVLVNSLKRGEVNISGLTMIILDECHHTTLDHPYNEIMKRYLDIKFKDDKADLPQIVGLSASLGVGEDDDAFGHIKTLCAAMDAMKVAEVQTNIEELSKKVNKPIVNKILSIPGRDKGDLFIATMTEIMKKIEDFTFEGDKTPHNHGTQQYENWIVEKRMTAERRGNREYIIACRYLREFNTALIIYYDLRGIDAINYLEDRLFTDELSPKSPTQIEKMCRRYYREKEKKLKELIALEEVEDNPKLEVLVSKLVEIYKRNKLSRGIVFGRTRAATAALKSFIGDQEQLCKFVQVDRLVGKGKEEDGFMNDGQQKLVLKNFRKGLQNGGINLLVATDVAQEGLDIPDCNFVFRYEFVSNEIGSVQARGRARAYAAICYLIVESNSINEKREKQNQKREEDMKKAMKQLREADEGELTEQIKQRQLVLLNEYKEAQKKKERRRNMHGVEGIRVLCKECNHFVCDATYLLKKGTHYICTDPEFFNRIRETRYRRPQVYRDTDNIGLICCGNDSCNKQFGPLVLYKKGVQMTACALSCRSLIFDMNSPYGLIQFPKWAKCSFPIREEQY